MLPGALPDIIQGLRRKKLIPLHIGGVAAHNLFDIAVLAALHNQLVQLPVQGGKLPGVGRVPPVKIVQQRLKFALQRVNLLVGNVINGGSHSLCLQKAADLVQVLHVLGGQGLDIGSHTVFNLQPALAGQGAQRLPHRRAAHAQLLCQAALAENIAGHDLALAQGVLDLVIGNLREVCPAFGLRLAIFHAVFHPMQ